LDDGEVSEWTRWDEQIARLRARWRSEKYKQSKERLKEQEMINLNGSDFNGSKGVTLEEGTYPVTLKGARIYKNEKYQSDELITQIDLIWDTGETYENDEGKEVPGLITDSFLTLSLNEKANLVKRLQALLGKDFKPGTARVELQVDGHENMATLPHRSDGRPEITVFRINGEDLFGKTAMVGVTINSAGYNRVASVSAPMRQGGARRAAPAGAPA
jgi:hypothetical protein